MCALQLFHNKGNLINEYIGESAINKPNINESKHNEDDIFISPTANTPLTRIEEQKHDHFDDNCVGETLIHHNTDRRKAIWDTINKSCKLIKCIGSLQMEYDEQIEGTEESIGTGTVIKIDEQNRCYILTVAHNFYQKLRQCVKCQRKTLRPKCAISTCNQQTKQVTPLTLIRPAKIEFKRRCIKPDKFGYPIHIYEVNPDNCYCRDEFYRLFPVPKSGYDICIMVFQCDEKEDIEMY
eukprot:296481_1